MKSWKFRHRKAKRRIPRNLYYIKNINRITREELIPKLIDLFIEPSIMFERMQATYKKACEENVEPDCIVIYGTKEEQRKTIDFLNGL